MENLSRFGVEPLLLFAQIINFLLLLYLLKRFLYKPILEIIKRREKKIQEGLEAAERGEQLLLKAQAEEKQILERAQEEVVRLLEEAKDQKARIEDEAMDKAKTEYQLLLEQARARMEEEEKVFERELERKAALAAAKLLERVLPKALTREDQLRIIESGKRLLGKILPS